MEDIEYTDIVDVMEELRRDGRELDRVVLTKSQQEKLQRNRDTVSIPELEGTTGIAHSINIIVGEENKAVASDGTEVLL